MLLLAITLLYGRPTTSGVVYPVELKQILLVFMIQG